MSRSRSGSASVPLILAFSVITIGLMAWVFVRLGSSGDASGNGNTLRPGATTHAVKKQYLRVSVTEDANLESSSNVEVKCKVTGGTTILTIVEDGEYVKQGDVIVTLDSSGIEEQKLAQEGILKRAEALEIQASQDAEAAAISIEEYTKGLFKQEKEIAEAQIIIAEENQRSAKNILEHTQKMARKGFAPPTQVEADEFAVKRADLELKASKTALDVLTRFTKLKMEKQLEALHEAAKARAESETKTVELENNKLIKLGKQFDNCTILAPQDGMVVFANERSRSGSIEIEVGSPVRQTQTILRLPDLANMQAKVLVNESKIGLLAKGMQTKVTVKDRVFEGVVDQIANQPESKSWFTAQVKEYATIVTFVGDTTGLKPGMTAEVEITIKEFENQLVVPVSAVVEQGRKHYCWVKTATGVERRPLRLGMTDDKVIAVEDGLIEDDVVILNPRAVVPEARDAINVDGEEETDEDKRGDKGTGDRSKSGEQKPKEASSHAKPKGASPAKPKSAGYKPKSFADKDLNGDGKIARDEVTGKALEYFDNSDTNGDGHIDKAENAAMKARMQKARSGAGGPQ